MFLTAYRLQRSPSTRLASWERRKSPLGAPASRIAGLSWAIALASLHAQIRSADIAVVAAAGAADRGGVAKVGIDTNKIRGHSAGANILNGNMPRAPSPVVGAITTAAVEFARVGDSVVANSDTSGAVGLNYFVRGASGTATRNENVA